MATSTAAETRRRIAKRIAGIYVIVGRGADDGPPTLDVARAALVLSVVIVLLVAVCLRSVCVVSK